MSFIFFSEWLQIAEKKLWPSQIEWMNMYFILKMRLITQLFVTQTILDFRVRIQVFWMLIFFFVFCVSATDKKSSLVLMMIRHIFFVFVFCYELSINIINKHFPIKYTPNTPKTFIWMRMSVWVRILCFFLYKYRAMNKLDNGQLRC